MISIRAAAFAGALFIACTVWVSGAWGALCPADVTDFTAKVRHVYDGDTVKLEDGRAVRLVGLNTPEISRDESPSDPYARAARRALIEMLDTTGFRVHGRYDTERRDRYGRTLAHLFLPDGNSLTAMLLQRGLGAAITVPPNVWNGECYFAAEAGARDRLRGMWSHPRFQPIESTRLSRSASGFRLIKGEVERVGLRRNSIWLDLPGGVSLRIDKRDLQYLAGVDPVGLKGSGVVARGWLYKRKGKLRMRIRHASAIEVRSK
ncbi:MAG: thermonuclease family protein [Pseudomonadota bacterium]|nr:thermonuclease family protein [Pseudomonadota bacterium]